MWRGWTRFAVCGALAVLLGTTGCGLVKERVRGAPHRPDVSVAAPDPSATGLPTGHTMSEVIVHVVALHPSELSSNQTITPLEAGDQVDGQVTLDLCGASFPSEKRRSARLQILVVDSSGEGVVSNENVAYDSPEAAKQAQSELRAAMAHCPKNRFVRPRVSDVPPVRYAFRPVPPAKLAHLAPDRLVVDAVLTGQDGQQGRAVAVYQWRGRIMVAAYGTDLDGVLRYAVTLRAHLDDLSPDEVGE